MAFSKIKIFKKRMRFFYLLLFFLTSLSYLFISSKKIGPFPGKWDGKKKDPLPIKKDLKFFHSPFYLKQSPKEPSFPALDSIKLFLYQPRPDLFESNLIEVVLGENKRVVSLNEKVFLKFDPEKSLYTFSENDMGFSISVDEKGSLYLNASYISINNKKIDREEILDIGFSKGEEAKFEDRSIVEGLEAGKFLAPDLFLKKYGKDKKSIADKYRLLIGKDTLYISNLDFLIKKDGKWRVIEDLKDAENFILARAVVDEGGSPKSLKIDIWPKEGIKKRSITLFEKRGEGVFKDFISEIRLRTKREVSCLLEKRRVVLREKDILFKKDGRWKIERLSKEKKDGSELFVFDGVRDSKFFVGYIFDKDRTRAIEVKKEITNRARNSLHKKRR